MDIQLRESGEADFEFVFSLNRANMKKYVDTIRGWDDDFERSEMKKKFTPRTDKIIQCEGQDIGVLRLIESDTELKLDHIELLPEHQNKGIGSRLIREMLDRADAEHKTVRLSCFRDNPATQLYKRLGFREVGKTEFRIMMERRPK